MTKEELEALNKEANEVLDRAAASSDYHERKQLHARYDEIFTAITNVTKDSLAEKWRAAGLDPYSPCPTCGRAILVKPKPPAEW